MIVFFRFVERERRNRRAKFIERQDETRKELIKSLLKEEHIKFILKNYDNIYII